MKQIKNVNRRWMRLTSLLLTLALLLAGCAGPAGGSLDTSEPAGDSSETSGSGGAGSSAAAPTEAADGSEGEGDTGEPAVPDAAAEAALLARMGLAAEEAVEISASDIKAIRGAVAGMQAAYVAGPDGKDPLVEERDWDIYTSSIAKDHLTKGEAAFYDQLDKLCQKYLSTSTFDGVKRDLGKGKVYYATDYVSFSNLGLSPEKALDVACWFKFNHPQYYFLSNRRLYTSDRLCLCMYENMADAEERAKITNELFDKLESWVQDVESHTSTTYEKELYANSLICEAVTYNYDALLEGHEQELSMCQSLYSVVILEDTVCSGYSGAFTAIMSALGADVAAALNDDHAWNVIRFDDGKYYAVDVCWNDTDSTPAYTIDYLNIGDEFMSITNDRKESHIYGDELAAWIPAIDRQSYKPSTPIGNS